jgi:hypothetical protein
VLCTCALQARASEQLQDIRWPASALTLVASAFTPHSLLAHRANGALLAHNVWQQIGRTQRGSTLGLVGEPFGTQMRQHRCDALLQLGDALRLGTQLRLHVGGILCLEQGDDVDRQRRLRLAVCQMCAVLRTIWSAWASTSPLPVFPPVPRAATAADCPRGHGG